MILELAAVPGCYTMKNTPKSIARISRGASSIADNIIAFNESPGAQAAITVLKIIKNLACARSGYREGVGNAFNSSAMVLCAPRFSRPGHFEAAGDLCVGKIYLGQDSISRFSGQGRR